jgi:uncharacterized protein YndB with AHSA1/START domain
MTAERKNELTIVRVLNAPRAKVWRACREPDALKEWWGQPKGATMPTCEVDFRIGGSLYIEVALPNGAELWFKWKYREIVESERLVLVLDEHFAKGRVADSDEFPPSTITMRFDDLDGKTRLTIVHAGMATEEHPVEQFEAGWSQSLDRLADSL